MKKKITIGVLFIIIFLLVIGVVIWDKLSPTDFTAVYLTTGDLLFGEETNFPSYGLKNAYTLQINPEDEENPISVRRFSENFWEPKGFLKINKENVIWSADLKSEGQLSQFLREGMLREPLQQDFDSISN